MRFLSTTEEMTMALGAEISKLLKPGQVIALYGDLGAGKTVFSRGFARGLGIEESVTSPTFTIAQEYHAPSGMWFYHLDMYRIDDERSALAFGVEEYLFASDAMTLVEWPERIEKLLRGDGCFRIFLRHLDDNAREIELPAELASLLPADCFKQQR